ncbi:MAG: 50S ribosomal protein L15 [Thainema sp.]
MRLQDALPKSGSSHRRRRVGRGISAGQGASCGFGMRGQKSRSGSGTRPGFEGGQLPLYRRIPKLKHFPIVNQSNYTIVNVGQLSGLKDGATVTLESLIESGIVTSNDGPLKVLGNGSVDIKLTVIASAFTASAKEKIEAAGGKCESSS